MERDWSPILQVFRQVLTFTLKNMRKSEHLEELPVFYIKQKYKLLDS
jgi:hypothetical protein